VLAGLKMLYWIEAANQSKKSCDASEPIGGLDSRATTDGSEPKLKDQNAKDLLNA
jgi:hypothetical protein